MAKRAYDHIYQQFFAADPPSSVTFGRSNADIISQGRGFVDGFDLTMQLQVGCPGGCLFCYVPAGNRLTPTAVRGPQGRHWGFRVRHKQNVLAKLRHHLRQGTLAGKTVYWSGVTDPYAAPTGVTRNLWQRLTAAPQTLRPKRLIVQTRFRPDRDVELMVRYAQLTHPSDGGPAVVVSYSIGTDRNDLIRAWERATPLFEGRLKAIETLRQAGLFVVPTLSPFGLWSDLEATLARFKSWRIPYITCLFFKENTRSADTPTRFLTYLRRHHPQLLDAAWQQERLQQMQAAYGSDRVLVGKAGFASLARPHLV